MERPLQCAEKNLGGPGANWHVHTTTKERNTTERDRRMDGCTTSSEGRFRLLEGDRKKCPRRMLRGGVLGKQVQSRRGYTVCLGIDWVLEEGIGIR